MEDSRLIADFLISSGVAKKDAGLVAEMTHTVDNLVNANEEYLGSLMWPDKSGKDRVLLNSRDINRVVLARENILLQVSTNRRSEAFRVHVSGQVQSRQLVNFLSVFADSVESAEMAVKITSIDNLIEMYRSGSLHKVGWLSPRIYEKLSPVIEYSLTAAYPSMTLQQLAVEREGYGQLIAITAYANQITEKFSDFDIRQFVIHLDASATISSWESCSENVRNAIVRSLQRADAQKMLDVARRCHLLFTNPLLAEERQVAFVFISALETVLTESAPRWVTEAIRSTHPFLVRPLFRSYPDALVFASGGKLASSLETIWGNRGEDLFLALGKNLRSVRNGGIDVVKVRAAYDVKSGPAVMNRDQVDILHIKQRIIEQDKRVPGLDTFKVALVYGQADSAFGTMAPDIRLGNILPARRAWEELTDDVLAPEKVYAIAGLVADLVGVSNSIASVTTRSPVDTHLSVEEINSYDEEFKQLFDNAFDAPSNVSVASMQRIDVIRNATSEVRNLLQ